MAGSAFFDDWAIPFCLLTFLPILLKSLQKLALQNKYGQFPRYPSIILTDIGMPTIKSIPGLYRFFFYSFDCNEQMHVHVQRERMICKFWMQPLVLARNQGFVPKEFNKYHAGNNFKEQEQNNGGMV